MGKVGDIRSKPRSDIVCLEGNGSRPSHQGNGYKIGGVMYTLNSTEEHGVCYAISDDRTSSKRFENKNKEG